MELPSDFFFFPLLLFCNGSLATCSRSLFKIGVRVWEFYCTRMTLQHFLEEIHSLGSSIIINDTSGQKSLLYK